jgi:adenylate cyclase class IV
MKTIEIEKRALLSKEKYEELMQFLIKKSQDLGEDDKETTYYFIKDKNLQVVNNISKGTAKVALKLTEVGGKGTNKEIISEIMPQQTEIFNAIFLELGFTHNMIVFQKRHNFIYKDVEIALKYSDSYKYHAELEVMSDIGKEIAAEKQITVVAVELGINLLSLEEEKELASKIKNGIKK